MPSCKTICEFPCVVELWSFLSFILKYHKADNSLGLFRTVYPKINYVMYTYKTHLQSF